MKKILFCLMCFISLSATAQVNAILGKWYTVDDNTGEKRSIVEIYKADNGMYYGKILELIGQPQDELCVPCVGDDHNAPVVGLNIIRDMKEEDGKLVGGRVLDPENGKFYYAKISLKDGKLVLRGSIDKRGLLGRSQTWVK